MTVSVSSERVPLPGRALSCVEGPRLVTGTRCEGPIIELVAAPDSAIHRIASAVLVERPPAPSSMTAMEKHSYVRPRP